MCDDREPPAKRSRYNLGSDSKSGEEASILETIRPMKLVDLNEDCLNEMFGHLSVIDLCYVSRVCKQLQQLAKSYFKRKYCDLNFTTLSRRRIISNQEATDVLSAFGSMISSISIQRQSFHNQEAIGQVEERVLMDIAEYCKELKTLKLKGFCFTSQAVYALNLLSDSLTKLTLDGSVFVDCVLHLNNFSSLERLILINSRDCEALLDTFPNLTCLELNHVSILSQYMLHHFIVRHRQLETLIIRNTTGASSAAFRFVAKYLNNLRIFGFFENSINPPEALEEINENILRLSELKSLTYLALSCYNLSIGKLLAKMVTNKISLNQINIGRCLNDAETTEAILQMKCLEELNFISAKNLNGEHLVKWAKELTRLKILTICLEQDISVVDLKEALRHTKELEVLHIHQRNFQLNSGLYNDILCIVKERRNGTTLEIHFTHANTQVLVPQGTIQANKNWLTIKQRRNN